MIEYLEKLVEEKEFESALAYAEKVLLDPDNTSWDLMAVYSRLSQARLEIGEFYGAQVAGQLAIKMAKELEAWDYFGIAAVALGVSYDRLAQPENAIAVFYDFLAHLPYYKESIRLHPMVLYNIGIIQAQIGQVEESLRTLKRAADVANALHDDRKAHGIRHALIDAHLRYGKLEEIPLLLAKCAHYLRHNVTARLYAQSRLWHLVLRVRFALATHRPSRAMSVAKRGLKLAEGAPHVQYHLHYLLAQVHELLGDVRSALNEAIRARGRAMEARRYDLEFAAANYVYGLLTNRPDLTDGFDTAPSEWDPTVTD